MNKLDIKIAFRTFLKGKWYNFLNIAGLAFGLAAFIFVTLYVDRETSYDHWNKNINRIFLVEREMPNGPSPYTPGLLAAAIKSQCPEVEETGRMNTALFQIPFYTSSGRFLIKKWVGADYSIAKIAGIKPKGFNLNPQSITPTILLSKATADVLFPNDSNIDNKIVSMMSKSGMPIQIAGVVEDVPGTTNFNFDCIGFSGDITSGKDQSYATQIYQTYILVKPNTNIDNLARKIDKLYKDAASADTSQVAKEALSRPGPVIYLDSLADLHLKPHYGSSVSNQIVESLTILAILILLVTGVNFTNLYASQANKRSKEVGIKKVSGISKRQLIAQFLLEIFLQCLFALAISFVIVAIGLPYFNQLLGVDLSVSDINSTISTQLFLTLITLTVLAGLYPSLMMARFKPAEVLRGDSFAKAGKFSWVSGSITMVQFTLAIGFIIILLVINQQVTFMKTENPGFMAKQVVYIDNLSIYNDPSKFEFVRNRIRAIPGVKNVTVATNVPGGIIPASYEYSVQSKAYAIHTIGVDYDYFETLTIGLKEGHFFSAAFRGDSACAVINETAARAMGLKHPIGTIVRGCGGDYRIIGVARDVKSYGFEQSVQPTIYVMSNHCGLAKTQIMIRADQKNIPALLTKLEHQWGDINKLDGDNFNYHFLDNLYGQLFIKQEQLQAVLVCFSVLAILIAALGFFASAAHTIHLRMKEIAIRKVFGAKIDQLLILLSKPFLYIVLMANSIAWPVSFVIATKWLETFAYRVHISATPFLTAMVISIALIAITVCSQIIKAVNMNPAKKLNV